MLLSVNRESTGARIEAYLVICWPAFPNQKIKFVQKVFDDFSKKYEIAAQTFLRLMRSSLMCLMIETVLNPGAVAGWVAVINVAA